ncbi:MAG: hypothetical protein KGI71_06635 [Patescibacteria group bacterium]|nr:hypothetical protein [Patescibacteria group bacterium]
MSNYNVSPLTTATEVFRPARLPRYVPDSAYLEAVRLYLRGGKPVVLAEVLNVSLAAVKELILTREWARTAQRYREESHHAESAALSRLIHLALEQVAERIERGDPHLTKSGHIIYAPIKARDLVTSAALLIERRRVINNAIDGVPDETQNDLARLFSLASRLRDIKRESESLTVEGDVEREPVPLEKIRPPSAAPVEIEEDDEDDV